MGRAGDQQTSSSANALHTPGLLTAGEDEAEGSAGAGVLTGASGKPPRRGGVWGGGERVFQMQVLRSSRRLGQRSEGAWN